MNYKLTKCHLCPRNCNVSREKRLGYCESPSEITISKVELHSGEETILSPSNVSGAIFFSYCPLRCIYCQNYKIISPEKTQKISIDTLAEIMLTLQEKGAENIDLVTPTHYTPHIASSIKIAKKKGLTLKIIYNTSGYESVSTLKMLDGLIDIYMPDFKYLSSTISKKYSSAPDYFAAASKALEEMYRQVGGPQFNKNGQMIKGMLVRHLILPGETEDSKQILKYLYQKYQDNIYISIMNQYTPVKHLPYPNLNHPLSKREYEEVIDYAVEIGIKKAFVQEDGTADKKYIPDF